MKRKLQLLTFAAAFTAALAASGTVLTNASDVAAVLVNDSRGVGDRFELCGQIMRKSGFPGSIAVLDTESGGTILHFAKDDANFTALTEGDFVRVTGRTLKDARGRNSTLCETVRVRRHGNVPPFVEASADDILSGRLAFRMIRLHGIVGDAFRDDIDSRFTFLIVNNGGESILVPIHAPDITDAEIEAYIGSEVVVSGLCDPQPQTCRRRCYHLINVDRTDDIRILKRADIDPFSVPDISQLDLERPSRIPTLGRHRTQGRVIAVWQGDAFLLKTLSGELCRVQLMNRRVPRYGDDVEAVGFPETDLYRINLTRAIWRPADDLGITLPEPHQTGIREILRPSPTGPVYDPYCHGKAVCMSGSVRSIPDPTRSDDFLYIETDGQLIRIDASANPSALDGLTLGCGVEVTGICVFDIHNWRGNAAFPRIYGTRIVLRTARDIRIVSYPSWWTPGRLLTVIAILLVALALIVAWNVLQRRIARLRFADRTRLAIELHDSLSQILTSVSLQVDAARELVPADTDKARARLDIASKTIDSCRNELKNCIRDLRDETLDTDDFNAAIRKVLAPVLSDATLSVRFNIPRHALSDNAAHATICIVRELATNAVRHGHATRIRVAGSLDTGRLSFSVSDNGCGFDQKNRPGIAEGHFGLEGIAERVRSLGGKFDLSSTPGHGTRAVITIAKLQES